MEGSSVEALVKANDPAIAAPALADDGPEAPDLETLRSAGRMIFSVQGMFCASCAMAVQRVIEKVPGVLSSNVNFTSGAALVKWEPERFDFGRLFDRVGRLGYKLSPLLDNNELNRSLQAQSAKIRLQLIVAAFFGMWSMLGSWMLYLGISAVAGIDALLVGWTATLFSLPVILYSGLDLYRAGWKTVRAGVPGMDALVSLGVWGSLLLSLWNLSRGSHEVYVDAATMLVSFLLAGRLIEIHARKDNLVAIDALRQLLPETARLILPDGTEKAVALNKVKAGDIVHVRAGERVPVDATIQAGTSQLDASLLTGESLPLFKQAQDKVLAGMVNLLGPLQLRVDKIQGERRIDKLGLRMLELFGAKSSMSRLADRFAAWLLPIAIAVSVLSLARSLWTGIEIDHALLASLSILVAACPCAVGLALPLAFSAGSARASRTGVLFRDPASVEALARADVFAFDKTGTLTTGQLAVAVITSARLPEDELIRIVASAENGVAHPVANAIVKFAQEKGITGLLPSDSVERHPAGVSYVDHAGDVWLIGSPGWLARHGVSGIAAAASPMSDDANAAPSAIVHAARNHVWEGRIELRDQIRESSLAALETLRREGCSTLLVTGDHAEAAHWVGKELAFDPSEIHASRDPDEKVRILQEHGRNTAFVGDGVNDTLVLAAAGCGVAINGANAVAITASGVVITRGGIEQIVQARSMAGRIMQRIRQNLVLSVCYNVAIIVLFFQVGVTPGVAAIAMLLSSMTVIGNSMRP